MVNRIPRQQIPVAERFIVGLDKEGILRTDHEINLWRGPCDPVSLPTGAHVRSSVFFDREVSSALMV